MEASVFLTLLTLFTPRTLANLVVQPSKPKPAGEIGLNKTQVDWLRALMATNRAPPMRGAVRGMVTFDSRPWLGEIRVPTLVVGGTHDTAVPQYHFDQLVNGIPGARGLLVERAGHPLIWTHTRELAEIVQTQWQVPVAADVPRADSRCHYRQQKAADQANDEAKGSLSRIAGAGPMEVHHSSPYETEKRPIVP